MTPAARIQAAIEVLDLVLAAAREGGAAADTIVQRYFSTRRYAGSKDRRVVRELVFAAIRACGEIPVSGRAAMLLLTRGDENLASGFDGSLHGPAPIDPEEPVATGGTAPAWLAERMRQSGLGEEELAVLVERAPLDVRVNTLIADAEVMASEIPGAAPIAGVPGGLRLPAGTNVESYGGRLEVQDAGSQIVAGAARVEPGMTVLDLCAGAGGKTLTLAAAMHNEGRIVASDTDRSRLGRLSPRAARAGVTIAETVLLNPDHELAALQGLRTAADVVLIDAPCSGTGTWRRNPESRWRITPARLGRLVETQQRLLGIGAALTRPGGALIYIVCSLVDEEGAGQVMPFLATHPGWTAEPPTLPLGRRHHAGVRLSPAHDGTDGFFVARLIAPC